LQGALWVPWCHREPRHSQAGGLRHFLPGLTRWVCAVWCDRRNYYIWTEIRVRIEWEWLRHPSGVRCSVSSGRRRSLALARPVCT
jgi:hypothetical protein